MGWTEEGDMMLDDEVFRGFKRLCESLNGKLKKKESRDSKAYVCVLPEPTKNVYVTAYSYKDGGKSVSISAYSKDTNEKIGELEAYFSKNEELIVSMDACGGSGATFWGEDEKFIRVRSELSLAPKSVKVIKIERPKSSNTWRIFLQ